MSRKTGELYGECGERRSIETDAQTREWTWRAESRDVDEDGGENFHCLKQAGRDRGDLRI